MYYYRDGPDVSLSSSRGFVCPPTLVFHLLFWKPLVIGEVFVPLPFSVFSVEEESYWRRKVSPFRLQIYKGLLQDPTRNPSLDTHPIPGVCDRVGKDPTGVRATLPTLPLLDTFILENLEDFF